MEEMKEFELIFLERVKVKYWKIEDLVKEDDHICESVTHLEWMMACSNQIITCALAAVVLDEKITLDEKIKNLYGSKERILEHLDKGFKEAEKKLWQRVGD